MLISLGRVLGAARKVSSEGLTYQMWSGTSDNLFCFFSYNASTIKKGQDNKHMNKRLSCFSYIVCRDTEFKKVVEVNKAAGIHFCHISFCF